MHCQSPPLAAARLVQLSAVGALAACSYAMCRTPAVPLVARQLGATPETVGLVVAASTLTGVALKFPAGALSDLVGRRAVLLAGAVVFAAMPFAYLAIGGLLWLAVTRAVHGSATALFGPVASASLSDLAPADRRGRWLSLYATLQGAGQAAGPALAAALVIGSDFTRVFVVSGVLGCLALAGLMGWPRSAARVSSEPTWARLRQSARAVLVDKPVLVTSLAQAGQFFIRGTLNGFLPVYALEIVGLTPSQIGWLFGLQTAAALASRPVFGAVSDRVGRRPLIVAGLVWCAGSMFAIASARSFALLATVTVVHGVGLALTTSAASAYVTDLARSTRYGAAHGLFGTIYDIGDALGPICAGVIVAHAGYAAAFRLAGGVALASAVVFAGMSRRWAAPLNGPPQASH